MAYETLGDIAEELQRMKADGMTHQSIAFALGQVYGDGMSADAAEARKLKEGI